MDRRWIQWHDNGALVWTWPLTLAVSGAGALLAGAAAVLWWAGPPGGVPPVLLSGTAVVVVAAAGRIGSAIELRHRERPLAQPPAAPDPGAYPGRPCRSMRRPSGVAYLGMTLGALFVVPAVGYWSAQPRLVTVAEVAVAAAMLTGCYLAVPAARFVVTATCLHVDTALHRTSVPRQLIVGFTRSELTIGVDLPVGAPIDVRVDSPLLDISPGSHYRTNARCQTRTAHRIAAMLRDVPAGPGEANPKIIVSVRRGMVAVAGTAAAVVAAITALIGIL